MANKEETKKVSKPKKERRFHPVRFFKEVIGELKKLTWPNKKELFSQTAAVLTIVIGMAIIIYVLDLIFSQGVGLLSRIG